MPELDVFQVIADPSRREILRMLSEDSLPINTLAQNFEMSRPAVSKHIKILEQANFISIENIGRERYCKLRQEGFHKLQEWMDFYDEFWYSRMKKLGDLMDEKGKKRDLP